jgi:arsenite methyltransferase
MKTPTDIKRKVIEKYGRIALTSSGGCGCCSDNSLEFSMIGDDYKNITGYVPEADLGLGCGVPTDFAGIQPGHRVLDLGSGAGNDCFVARSIVGEKGHVVGLDFTTAMVLKARENSDKMGYTNVQFIQGDIEEMPLNTDQFDVVLSNCVLNLVPDKSKAFAEIFRVLKPGGHFCISDVVSKGKLPEGILKSAELYVGCVAGALPKNDYLDIIVNAGFNDIEIHKERLIDIPKDLLKKITTEETLNEILKSGNGIYSITVSGWKK